MKSSTRTEYDKVANRPKKTRSKNARTLHPEQLQTDIGKRRNTLCAISSISHARPARQDMGVHVSQPGLIKNSMPSARLTTAQHRILKKQCPAG